MRRALLGACLFWLGCAGVNPDGTSNCAIIVAGDIDSRFAPSKLDQHTLNQLVNKALDAASLTADWRLNDQTANCQAMVGFRVYTKATWNYSIKLHDGRDGPLKDTMVSGHTHCTLKYLVVGTPERDGRVWWNESSLVHELFHVMQGCESPGPIDKGEDFQHSNWARDGLNAAIEEAKKP